MEVGVSAPEANRQLQRIRQRKLPLLRAANVRSQEKSLRNSVENRHGADQSLVDYDRTPSALQSVNTGIPKLALP